MQWLSFLGYLACNTFSYATSSVGFSIAAILAVFKTNVNQSFMLSILLVMCTTMIAGLVFMFKILTQAFIEIGRGINHQNNLFSILIPLIKLLLLARFFFPIMYAMTYTISFFPAIILYVAGYHKEANFYLKELMGNHPYGNR